MKKLHVVGFMVLAVFAAAIIGLYVCGASVFSGGFVPTAEYLRDPSHVTSIFNITESELKGIFCYIDTYSIVYRYRTGVSEREEFWRIADSRAQEHGWTQISDHGSVRRYRRVMRTRAGARKPYVEEVRIGLMDDLRVVVAYAEISVTRIPESLEAKIPQSPIWPRFEDAMK